MNRYLKWLVLAALSVVGFLLVYGVVCHNCFRTPQFSLWIKNCLEKKTAYALSIEGRKIVLLSGSNTLFGVSAAEIEAETGVPAVNMAVHYGLQIDYMVENIKKVLMPGDILVLPLEYHHYSYDGGYSLIQSSYIRTYDREYYNNLPFVRRLRHIINTTPLDLLKSIREQINFKGIERPAGRGVYNSKNLNDNGDETSSTEPLMARLDREQPLPIRPVSERTYGFSCLIDFSQWCRQNGVTLLVTWPNAMWFDEYMNQDYERYFSAIEAVLKKHEIFLGRDRMQSFFKKNYMYDGFYHLNSEGIKLRTSRIIKELRDHKVI